MLKVIWSVGLAFAAMPKRRQTPGKRGLPEWSLGWCHHRLSVSWELWRLWTATLTWVIKSLVKVSHGLTNNLGWQSWEASWRPRSKPGGARSSWKVQTQSIQNLRVLAGSAQHHTADENHWVDNQSADDIFYYYVKMGTRFTHLLLTPSPQEQFQEEEGQKEEEWKKQGLRAREFRRWRDPWVSQCVKPRGCQRKQCVHKVHHIPLVGSSVKHLRLGRGMYNMTLLLSSCICPQHVYTSAMGTVWFVVGGVMKFVYWLFVSMWGTGVTLALSLQRVAPRHNPEAWLSLNIM